VSGQPSDEALRWQVHGERTLYDNRWVRLAQVDVTAPDGARWWHHVVRLQTVALAVVLDDRDRVLMLWRHRFAVDAFGWELPGGIVAAGESGVETAVRETVEETGWRPSGPGDPLISYQPMPGMVDTPHEVYLFRGAEHIGDPTDAEEAGRVGWLPLTEVLTLVRRGEMAGSGSLVGLLYLLASRGGQHRL
jgi:8-oxo-dGTP pyrophosphatase MutT (NUDIX family)